MKFRTRFLKPATAHVLMVSFLLGGVGALFIGLQQSLKAAEESIRPALKVAVFVQDNVSDEDARKWAASLPAQDAELESAEFVSRKDAFQKALETSTLSKSLLLLRENPFPATVLLHYKDWAWLERPEPALALKSQPQVQEIRWNPEVRSVFRSLRQWRTWLERLTVFALIMLVVWCLFGAYRFFALKAPAGELFIQLGIGLIGGSISIVTWGLSLRGVGADAALYKPEAVSFWPLVAALLASLATFGWDESHDA